MVQTLNPHFFPNAKHPSRLNIPPPILSAFFFPPPPPPSTPSSTNSQITPTGLFPANLQNSTAASVWPLRSLIPPSLALKGKTCPGLLKDSLLAPGEASVRQVSALSYALIPVVVSGWSASTDTVYAVRFGSAFASTICGRSRDKVREVRIGLQIRPEE